MTTSIYKRTYPKDNDREVSAEEWTPFWSGDNKVQKTRAHNMNTSLSWSKRMSKNIQVYIYIKRTKKVEMPCRFTEIISLIYWGLSKVQWN